MLILKYVIAMLSPIVKVTGAGVICWLYIRQRTAATLWLALAMIAVVLADIVGMFFASEIHVIETGISAKTLAYDIQRGLYFIHYTLLLLAGLSMLKSNQK